MYKSGYHGETGHRKFSKIVGRSTVALFYTGEFLFQAQAKETYKKLAYRAPSVTFIVTYTGISAPNFRILAAISS